MIISPSSKSMKYPKRNQRGNSDPRSVHRWRWNAASRHQFQKSTFPSEWTLVRGRNIPARRGKPGIRVLHDSHVPRGRRARREREGRRVRYSHENQADRESRKRGLGSSLKNARGAFKDVRQRRPPKWPLEKRIFPSRVQLGVLTITVVRFLVAIVNRNHAGNSYLRDVL